MSARQREGRSRPGEWSQKRSRNARELGVTDGYAWLSLSLLSCANGPGSAPTGGLGHARGCVQIPPRQRYACVAPLAGYFGRGSQPRSLASRRHQARQPRRIRDCHGALRDRGPMRRCDHLLGILQNTGVSATRLALRADRSSPRSTTDLTPPRSGHLARPRRRNQRHRSE
jgi:hypothetical protein